MRAFRLNELSLKLLDPNVPSAQRCYGRFERLLGFDPARLCGFLVRAFRLNELSLKLLDPNVPRRPCLNSRFDRLLSFGQLDLKLMIQQMLGVELQAQRIRPQDQFRPIRVRKVRLDLFEPQTLCQLAQTRQVAPGLEQA